MVQIVDFVFTEMGDYFIRAKAVRSGTVKLTYPGFGTFSKRRRPERIVKLPNSPVTVTIPLQYTVTFSPGKELKSLMNQTPRKKVVAGGK